MDKMLLKRISKKYILAIASNRYEDLEESGETRPVLDLAASNYSSIPDAWIFDANQGYCYLIEAKVGHNPLDYGQIISHARDWLGIRKLAKVQERFISITWLDVIEALREFKTDDDSDKFSLNSQEIKVVDNFEEFLSFFGYKWFIGVDFKNLQAPPEFRLAEIDFVYPKLFNFSNLSNPPALHLPLR